MHPFDLKTVLLAKHAQHVVIIHFPIALFIVGVAFDVLGQLRRNDRLRTAAYYNLCGAALSVPFAVVTGILAWQWQLNGQRLHGLILEHLILGSTAGVLIVLVWWIHYRSRNQPTLPAFRLLLEAGSVLLVAVTGHLGGFLSGVNAP